MIDLAPDEWADETKRHLVDLVGLGDDSEVARLAQASALIECARHLGRIERHLAALAERADLTKREF